MEDYGVAYERIKKRLVRKDWMEERVNKEVERNKKEVEKVRKERVEVIER